MFEYIRTLGVTPSVLIGHSVGEIAAARASRILSLDHAARLVVARGRAMQAAPVGGVMIAVAASETDVQQRITALGVSSVDIAAVNGPAAVVISGEAESSRALASAFEADGVRTTELTVSHAFHSPAMDSAAVEIADLAHTLEFHDAEIPVLSTSGDGLAGSALTSPAYWGNQIRAAVRFADAVEKALDDGGRTFVEFGPAAVLAAAIPAVVESVRGVASERIAIVAPAKVEDGGLTAVPAGLIARGWSVDWSGVAAGGRVVELPTYRFERHRFWLTSPEGTVAEIGAAGLRATGHPLLAGIVTVAEADTVLLTGRLSLTVQPWLADHVVSGRILLPGTAFVELFVRGADEVGFDSIVEAMIETPLALEAGDAVDVQVCIGPLHEDGTRSATVHSRGADVDEWTRHASGTVGQSGSAPAVTESQWPPVDSVELPVAGVYDILAEAGFTYGPQFRGVHRAWQLANNGIAVEVELPEGSTGATSFALHPALLDSVLHSLALGSRADGTASGGIPFLWRGVRIHAVGAEAVRAVIREAGDGAVAIELADTAGNPVASVAALTLRRPQDVTAGPSGLHEVVWMPSGIVVSEDSTTASGVTLVYAESPDTTWTSPDFSHEVYAVVARIRDALAEATDAAVLVITRGGVAVDSSSRPDPFAAAVAGAARSIAAEHRGRVRLLDLPALSDGSVQPDNRIAAVAAAAVPEAALRGNELLVPELRPGAVGSSVPVGRSWSIRAGDTGSIDELVVADTAAADAVLGSGEVRIAVGAAGLNFRDVMIALGMYPGFGAIGGEFAGTVLEVGPDVSGVAVGDRVMGIVADAFADLVIADRRMIAPVPDGWSIAEAAATPIAYLTAWYALVDLAKVRRGASILVHSGAGGVGSATIAIAHHLGLEVYATASPGKWDALLASGVRADRIGNSRNVDAAADLAPSGGFDVVLNSFAREFVDAALAVTSAGGAFLEMGKTDIRDADAIANDRDGLRYRAFDLHEAGRERTADMFDALTELFASGELAPPAITAFDIRRLGDAMRFVQHARHIGKVVVTVPESLSATTRTAGTVLVTGGTGTVGSALARHLASDPSVDRVLVVSRSGPYTPQADAVLRQVRELGVEAEVIAADLTDPASLSVLREKLGSVDTLRSVVHASGAAEDALLDQQNADSTARVFAAKVLTAATVRELCRESGASLILLSSVAAVLGSPGQANYAAANAVLDAIAAADTSVGRQVRAIRWGLWEAPSAISGDLSAADLVRVRRTGMVPLTTERAVELFDAAQDAITATPVAITVDRSSIDPTDAPPLLRSLAAQRPRRRTAAAASGASAGWAADIALVGAEDRVTRVTAEVAAEVAAVLGLGRGDLLDPDRAFRDLGIDSLTAVELRNRLTAKTGLSLPTTLVFDHPTTTAVATALLDAAGVGLGSDPTDGPSADRATAEEDPIVIVSMSCRYPGGADSPEALWSLLENGVDAIGPFPIDRGWDIENLYHPDPDHAGTSYTQNGGFLYDAGEFEPSFFGINPREALAMDPQQRLLLETAWECFERVGLNAEGIAGLRGSRVGVYAGVIHQDYISRLGAVPSAIEGYVGNGTTGSVASGRVAYTFGLEGPAVTVDTACSSSLVALHFAMDALRKGECSMALVGGVAVMSSAGMFIDFSRQRGLAPDGRCKAFSESADGTAWGEGAGMILVERLSEARRQGHEVLAVVRGTAVNSDGASNGLTAPNGPSQQRVITAALRDAGLTPSDIDVVEAHGTGTALGDPIEAQALLATYGRDRDADRPLLLGSMKSNIGHTQSAAGVAGIIKLVLSMQNGVVPRTLHVSERSSHVDWNAGAVELATETMPWPERGGPRRSAVSSFGISGTNAHVVLEAPPGSMAESSSVPVAVTPTSEDIEDSATAYVLSAKSSAALAKSGERLRSFLVESDPSTYLPSAAFSLASGSTTFEHRAVVITAGEPDGALAALAEGLDAPELVTGRVIGGGTAFLFTGQGAQRVGAGRQLAARFPVFADALSQVCAEFDRHLPRPLAEVMWTTTPADRAIHNTRYAQAALFATEVALFRLVESWGVVPDYLLGHSIGELAAAHVAGVWTLQDAVTVVAARGRLMAELPGSGAMVALAVDESTAISLIDDTDSCGTVDVAAVNGPHATVLSGASDSIGRIADAAAHRGFRAKRLTVSHAFHSPQMDPMLDEFARILAGVQFTAPTIPIVSDLTGKPADDAHITTPQYWVDHVRHAVRFADGVTHLREAGVSRIWELGPDTVLSSLAEDVFVTTDAIAATFTGSLRREADEVTTVLTAAARMYVAGAPIRWSSVVSRAPRISLPTYAFARDRFWLSADAPSGTTVGSVATSHPMLSSATPLADGDGFLFTSRLSVSQQAWIVDHVVMDTIIVPGTALLEMGLRVCRELGCELLDEFTLEAPLVLPSSGGRIVQIHVGDLDETGRRAFAVHSTPEDRSAGLLDGEWTRHGSGFVAVANVPATTPPFDATVWPPPGAKTVDHSGFYELFAETGFRLGRRFRGITGCWRATESDGTAVVYTEMALPEDVRHEAAEYGIHPALLDNALQSMALEALDRAGSDGSGDAELQTRMPFSWGGARLHRSGSNALRVRIRMAGDDTMALDVADSSGRPVATIDSLVARPVTAAQIESAAGAAPTVYEVTLVPVSNSAQTNSGAALTDGARTTVRSVEHDPVIAVTTVGGVIAAHIRSEMETGELVVVASGLAPAGAAVLAYARTAGNENPGAIRTVDSDENLDDEEWGSSSALAAALAAEATDVVIRDGELYVRRLTTVTPPESIPSDTGPSANAWSGTVVISGGLGALGTLFADHCVHRHGVTSLVLLGRNAELSEAAAEQVSEWRLAGVRVHVAAVDVCDPAGVAAALDGVPNDAPVTAVLHAAGVLDDAMAHHLTEERIESVLRPKVIGARVLREACPNATMVLFSSAAGVLGNPGQAAYAAANAYLDTFAKTVTTAGVPVISMAWGQWTLAGSFADSLSDAAAERIRKGGLEPLDAATGTGLFEAALASGVAAPVTVRLDGRALKAAAAAGSVPPVLAGLVPASKRAPSGGSSGELLALLAGTAIDERSSVMVRFVRERVAEVLGHGSVDDIEPDMAFLEMGFDSLTGVELRNRLNTVTGLRLATTAVFNHPTPIALASNLLSQLEIPEAGGKGSTAGTVSVTAAGGGNPLVSVFRSLCDRDQYISATRLMMLSSALRDTFDADSAEEWASKPVTLCTGEDAPMLVCFPAFSAVSGPHEYARLSTAFRDERDVVVLPAPGFVDGDRVPADYDTFIRLQADIVADVVGERRFVVAGRSAGGWIAHGVTEILEARGIRPDGLVLVDTYIDNHNGTDQFLSSMLRGMLARDGRFDLDIRDTSLTAMGTYLQLFAEWAPADIVTPTLQIRATEINEEAKDDIEGKDDWAATWPLPHEVRDVPGDHFTMLEDHSETTAAAIRDWITARGVGSASAVEVSQASS